MAEEPFTHETPFLISGGGCDGAESMGSSGLAAGGKADTGVIDTICGAVDAGGGAVCGGTMRLNICSIDCCRKACKPV